MLYNRLIAALALGAVLCTISTTSHGACPNFCELTVTPVVADPPLVCGTLSRTYSDGCDCGMAFDVSNGADCTSPIEAIGFEFGCYPGVGLCTILAPGLTGRMSRSFDTTGEFLTSVVVRDSAGDHRLETVAKVTDFPDQTCFCSVPGRSSRSTHRWLGPAILVVLLARARREPSTRMFRV